METWEQWKSVDLVVKEIMRIHRSLPTRPCIDDVEAAKSLVQNIDKEELSRMDSISRQTKTPDVPQELFDVLIEMHKHLSHFQGREDKREAMKVLDLENTHFHFDEFIQKASRCLSPSPSASASISATKIERAAATEKEPVGGRSKELFYKDDNYLNKSKYKSKSMPKSRFYYSNGTGVAAASSLPTPQLLDSTTSTAAPTGQDGENLTLTKLASLIEVSAKKGTRHLDLRNKLVDQIEWLPDSIGKLARLLSLDLSENRILVLPTSIGSLSSLTKLDLHSNRIVELPESFGDLLNLAFLNVKANQLSSLPSTFGQLVSIQELDLSSNNLSMLPESIGSLTNLRILNVETNDIEELPHTIRWCSALKELQADYNRLKALPEAIGKVESLEVLSLRYNNIKRLPTTMSSLLRLKELDVSFNELEFVPESLCFATSLIKMNVGNNFADLRSLPRSIGNLENLRELDISNNQICILPDSFRMLTQLRVLCVEENPLEVPPRHIAEKGAQAMVQYMAELVEKRDAKPQPIVKQKHSWTQLNCFLNSNKRKSSCPDHVKT